jgi:hypothetical protein
MGCMKKLGCLALVVVIAVVAFLYRDGWIRILPGGKREAGSASSTWQALTPEGAKRVRTALQTLRAPRGGPVYVNVAPGDLGAYILQELAKSLPASADSIEAAAIGDRLYVRAVVKTSELGGSGALGPLSALLGERERIQLGGTLRIIRPGFAELQVKEMKLGSLTLPQALIPRLIQQISRGLRPPEISPEGLPLQTPEYIGDVRVSDGRITLYKTIPAR